MKLRIQDAGPVDNEALRTLLLDNIDELAGGPARILEPKLPWEGHPILAVDAQLHPLLVSFDCLNAQAALLGGLQAVEQIGHALPWINQVYEPLQNKQLPPRLVVVSPEAPAGAGSVLGACPDLKLFSYRVLRVNDETGLWLEAIAQVPSAATADQESRPAPTLVAETAPAAPGGQLPALSEEEKQYFRQL